MNAPDTSALRKSQSNTEEKSLKEILTGPSQEDTSGAASRPSGPIPEYPLALSRLFSQQAIGEYACKQVAIGR